MTTDAIMLRTPGVLLTRLLVTSINISLALGLIVLLTAAPVLGLDEAGVLGLQRVLGCFIAAGFVGSVGSALVAVRRARPLYDALERARVTGDTGTHPPEVAMRATYREPLRMLVVFVGSGAAVLMMDLAMGSPISKLEGAGFWAVWLFVLAWVPLALYPMLTLWRRSFSGWLNAVPPRHFNLATEGSLARRCIARVAFPLLSICCGLASVFLSHMVQPETSAGGWGRSALIVLVIVGIPSLGGWAAWLMGRHTALDLRHLKDWMGVVVERESLTGQEMAVRPACATSLGRELAEAIEGLQERQLELAAQQAAARQKVEAARRMKSRFLAYMSHDLRSPLNSIQGFAEILSRQTDGPLNAQQLESVEMIRESGDELLRLVTNILDTAKIEAGRMRLHRQWVPPVETITQAVGQVRALAVERDVNLDTELAAGLPPLYVDGQRVLQALSAVLRHSVRVTRGSTVLIQACVDKSSSDGRKRLKFSVVDSASGIRVEDCERIQEVLREVDQPTGRPFGGVGLGLSLALTLFREHGGDLWFEWIPGAQARFDAVLPVESEATAGA